MMIGGSMKYFVLILTSLGLTAAQAADAPKNEPTKVSTMMKNAKGEEVGDLTLSREGSAVKMVLNVKNLPAGQHALHFHQNGTCTAPDFKSAGDHFSPKKMKHGEVKGGPHEGDLKNFEVKADGTAHVETVLKSATLDNKSLLKEGGTSLVIHAKADDYKTQPSGDSGDRIACGEIKATN